MTMMIKRYPFNVGISTLIVAIVITLTGLFLWISHRESKAVAIQMADRLFSEINAKTLARYESALESVAVLAGSAARMPGMTTLPVGGGLSHPGMSLMFEALTFYEYLFSTYIGYDNGSFIQVVAVRNQRALQRLYDAPVGTYFILRSIAANSAGRMKQRWLFLNRERQVTGERTGLDSDYDPRTRPWYVRAQQEQTAFYTEPYIFSATKIPGITCAEKLMAGGGVFGADITLGRFSFSLKRQKVSDNGVLFLFDQAGRLIVHSKLDNTTTVSDESLNYLTAEASGDPLTRTVVANFQSNPKALLKKTKFIKIDGLEYLIKLTGLKAALKFTQILASVAPVSDFTGHIRRMQQRVFIFSGLVLLVVLPLTLLVSRKISVSLSRLEGESIKIQRRDFSESALFDSRIREIHSLIQAFGLMKSTIRQLLEQQRKLFDDFTKLIAGAIDAKSPYTGGHCARVPKVAELLIDAACKAEEGPFADFRMDTKDQRWEFEVAAWLHDCGKVTTPEYVVDKATKLETIYNRIHEIRMRFEVLLRDAEIADYQKRLAGDVDESLLEAQLAKEKKQISDHCCPVNFFRNAITI